MRRSLPRRWVIRLASWRQSNPFPKNTPAKWIQVRTTLTRLEGLETMLRPNSFFQSVLAVIASLLQRLTLIAFTVHAVQLCPGGVEVVRIRF